MIILLSIILFVLILILGLLGFVIFKNTKEPNTIEIEKPLNVEVCKLLLDKESLEKVNSFIDSMVNDSIHMYQIMEAFTSETYITKEMADEMSLYCFGMTKNKMTNSVKSTIGLFYDISTEEKLDDVLKLRIKLNIVSKMIEQNVAK